MEIYQVGNGLQQIKMAVDIDTFGLAASRAVVFDMATDDPSHNVGCSTNATGDISQTPIGQATSLQNKRLSVLTKIDLIGDASFKQKESERLGGKYILDDGTDGHKVFDNPEKTIANDFSSVILSMYIDFIA